MRCSSSADRAITRDLNHDEHQFLAPGALLARQGLLPYRDYPLFHLPNLTFCYALLDLFGAQLVLTAKLFSVASTVAIGILLALVCCPSSSSRRYLLVGTAGLLTLVFFDPLFDFTIGKTWNHEFPSLCLVLALLLTVMNSSRDRVILAILAGIVGGVAVGARLTFLTVAVPLCAAPLLFTLPLRRRLILVAAASGGFVLAMAPTLWLWVRSPEAFIFDNFQFPRLRLLDPTDTRAQKTMVWWRKLRFFLKEVALPSWPLFLAYLLIGVRPAVRWFRERSTALFPSALILLALPLVLVGCFAPSRYQYQHYYVFIPLLALGIAHGLQVMEKRWAQWAPVGLAALSLISVISALIVSKPGAYAWIKDIGRSEEWYSVRVQEFASAIRSHVTHGKVLTLAPTWPLEAGLETYPEFATGVFAWRASGLMSAEQRARLKFVAPADLEAFLAKDPPSAVLTGVEDKEEEEELVDYAKTQHLERIELGKKKVLWVRRAQ